MRKLIAIIAALGLFGVTTMSPVYAASGGKKAKAAMASPTKKPAKVKKTKKSDAVILYRISA